MYPVSSYRLNSGGFDDLTFKITFTYIEANLLEHLRLLETNFTPFT
jgi:hypothetical protein